MYSSYLLNCVQNLVIKYPNMVSFITFLVKDQVNNKFLRFIIHIFKFSTCFCESVLIDKREKLVIINVVLCISLGFYLTISLTWMMCSSSLLYMSSKGVESPWNKHHSYIASQSLYQPGKPCQGLIFCFLCEAKDCTGRLRLC